MPTPVLVILIAVAALVIFVFGFTYYAYSVSFKRKRRPIDLVKDLGIEIAGGVDLKGLADELRKLPFEEVKITSHDGLTLVGRYYSVEKGAPVHILCHGYNSSPVHDFCASVDMNLEAGHNVLLIYQRAHGRSEGRSLTFGYKESRDVSSWVDYIIEREGDGVEILLAGVSMGAATVIIASALDLPSNVKCVVADCPYSTAKEEIMLTAKRMGFPPRLVYPFVRLGGAIFAGFDPDLASPVEAARASKLPVLLIHGEEDSFVPKYMSDAIYAAHTGVMEYHVFEGADHGMSCLVDPERYHAICAEFASRYIGRAKAEMPNTANTTENK
ncbi:MAG: alpha/beta hydrolase [Clostridia bacterium]|nr:alpha/beta hydrolase [Clostridia bacterium]